MYSVLLKMNGTLKDTFNLKLSLLGRLLSPTSSPYGTSGAVITKNRSYKTMPCYTQWLILPWKTLGRSVSKIKALYEN